MLAQLASEVTAIDVILTFGGDAAQRLRQGGYAHYLAGARGAAIEEQLVAARLGRAIIDVAAQPVRVAAQFFLLRAPAQRDQLRNRITVLGGPDGRLEHIRQGHASMARQQVTPTGDGAGDADSVTGEGWHFRIAKRGERRDRCGGWCAS